MRNNEMPPPLALLHLVTSSWTTHLLNASCELKFADALKDGPLTAKEVAERSGTVPTVTYRMLRGLASLGVLTESPDKRFTLTEMGQMLRSDVPHSMRGLAMMIGRPWHTGVWQALAECARKGGSGTEHALGSKNLWEYFDAHEEELEIVNEAMTGASNTMHVTAVAAYDFSGIGTLVDVGGGHGRLLGMVLAKHPGMRGILFDRPHLEEGARAELAKLGIADRAQFVGGDFFKSVPAGGDVYMMSHILHDWPDQQALALLRNCRNVMQKGARLLVLDAVIKPPGESDWGKLMDLEMMVMFGGCDRTADEISALFTESGFVMKRVIPTRSTTSIVEGVAV